MSKPKHVPDPVIHFVEKYLLLWYLITVILYFIAIPLTIWIFPASTLHLAVLILFTGFTSSIAAFATALVDSNDD